jgi:hypothetical protein
VLVHEQYGRLHEEAAELVKQPAHRETALRLGLGAGEREANPLYGGDVWCGVGQLAQAAVGESGQAELGAVIRGYKGATLYASPGAALEGLDGCRGLCAWWCWCRS